MVKKKKKSIIRYEAIIPLIVVLLLSTAYGFIFLDSNLKFALEWALTRAHGAEVNVGKVETRLKDLNISIYNVQFTYDKRPNLNIVQFKQLELNMLWKALLQSKYIIPQAQLQQIETLVPRQSPGRVLALASKTGFRGASNNIKEQIHKKVEGNILTDIYKVSQGTDFKDQLKNIQYNLKSDQKIKQLESEFKNKKNEWNKKIEQLPTKKDIETYEKRIKSLELDSKKVKNIVRNLKEAKEIYSAIKKDISKLTQTSTSIKTDFNNYQNQLNSIDQLVNEDMKGLERKLNLPSFDASDISKGVFFPIIQSKLLELKRYITMAQSHLPKSKKGEIAPPKRGVGKNYYFPKKNSYPKFWLKKLDISSKLNESDFSGDFKGTISNISNNPKHIGLPMIAKIAGDSPQQKIKGINALITIDHTNEKPIEKIDLSVASFPAKDLILSKTSDLTMQIAQSLLSSKVSAHHSEGNFKLNLANTFNQADYLVEGPSEKLKSLVYSTLKKMKALTIDGTVEGNWSDFTLSLNSNFGKELSGALQGQLKGKIAEAQALIKEKFFSKFNSQKSNLNKEFRSFSKNSLKDIKSKEDLLKQLTDRASSLSSKKPSLKDFDKDEVKEKGKKILKDLFG